MNRKLPHNDPIGAYQRKATATRRVGAGAQCACGESRPEALIEGSMPITCAACQRKEHGQTVVDAHHIAGRANDPGTTVVPVNDHRADLTPAQQDWPRQTLQNQEGCPLLKGAGCIRGVIDYLHYLIDKFLMWIPEMLETLSAFMRERFGSNWWVGTPLAKFAPER